MKAHLLSLGVLFGILALMGGGAYLLTTQTLGISYASADPSYNQEYWSAQIQRKGATRAYEEFIQRNAREDFGRQHLAAHVIGETLYKEVGMEGITACDSNFGFGCYHGFFGRALSARGERAVTEVSDLCIEVYGTFGTGCLHGIGHGILEYTGYDKLVDALNLCTLTTQVVPLLGCTSGVFMEYNTPLAGISDALIPSARPFDFKNPLAPCPSVPKEFQSSCYFELGSWLSFTQESRQAGETCTRLRGEDRMHCFLGIGSSLPPLSQYSLQVSRETCAAFSDSDELSCRAGVAWGFYVTPEHRADTVSACWYTDTKRQKECLSRANLTHQSDWLTSP